MAPGLTRTQLFEWANIHLESMRALAKYGHVAGRCMVQFIVEARPELKGTVTFQMQESLKREAAPNSPLGKSLLTLLEVYDPEHDFVAGIMCDGQIVSMNLISQSGPIGFTETDVKSVKRVVADSDSYLN